MLIAQLNQHTTYTLPVAQPPILTLNTHTCRPRRNAGTPDAPI